MATAMPLGSVPNCWLFADHAPCHLKGHEVSRLGAGSTARLMSRSRNSSRAFSRQATGVIPPRLHRVHIAADETVHGENRSGAMLGHLMVVL
jgi:hypothetical protein